MSDIISIPLATSSDGVVYYQIHVNLPLRSYTVQRRYNEFEKLVSQLARDIGVDVNDLPYQLPGKRWFRRLNEIVEERRLELAKLLNEFIKNSQCQNNHILLKFLQLPINFRFNKQIFQPNISNTSILIDSSQIDESNWLEIYRNLKSCIQESTTKSQDKFKIRELINRDFQPCLKKLQTSLEKFGNKLDLEEFDRRQTLLKSLTHQLETLRQDNQYKSDSSFINASAAFGSTKQSARRIFGSQSPPNDVKETKDTIELSNQELLQKQIQIHKMQDQEVEQLRHLISRQRQLGELIHSEVEDQNNMLDAFHNELDTTESKLNNARRRAKKITQ